MFPLLSRSSVWTRSLYGIALFLILPNLSLSLIDEIEVRDIVPAPIVVSPSQDWDGNDGPWSSFTLQIGNPPQVIKVLVSTAATQTWAVATEGCTTSDPSNCFDLRGRLYNYNDSSTWEPNLSNITSYIYPLGLEASLGYSGLGRYGFDDITLGWKGSGGPTLKNQTLAGIAAKDFFLGVFGLTPRPSNFTTYNEPTPSYMENLKNQSLIPSLSWAYTAGNQYRLNNVLGSLTLGGYDTSKFISNDLTFAFAPEDNRDLIVQLQNIATGTSTSLLPTPIPMFLDSTVPYIYLPTSACTLFETTFGLVWDDTTELYLLNETQQTALQTQNASITFSLRNLTSSTTINITFPYSAFELIASYPLVENATKYFPLKRAANKTQYTLGRTFFQEAYVIADYERKNFSVSACKYDPLLTQNIVAILPPSNATNSTSSSLPSPSPQPSKSLPTAAIGGIAGGSGALVICVASLLMFCLRRKKKVKAAELAANSGAYQEMMLKPELDGTEKPPEIYETDGRKYVPPAVVKISGQEIEPVYEMEAREEVAAELMGGSRDVSPMPSQRPSPSASPSPSGRVRVLKKQRKWGAGWIGTEDEGQEQNLRRGLSRNSGNTVSPGMSPRSISSSVVSPASEGGRTYQAFRPPDS